MSGSEWVVVGVEKGVRVWPMSSYRIGHSILRAVIAQVLPNRIVLSQLLRTVERKVIEDRRILSPSSIIGHSSPVLRALPQFKTRT